MFVTKEDLLLIGGDFITASVPKDREWLKRYFKDRPIMDRFIVYYLLFSDLRKKVSQREFGRLFIEHTGWYLTRSAILFMMQKLNIILKAETKALKAKDLFLLAAIRAGDYRQGFWVRKGRGIRKHEGET